MGKVLTMWQHQMMMSANGAWKTNLYNASIATQALIKSFYYDEMSSTVIVNNELPWNSCPKRRIWTDIDTLNLTAYLQQHDLQVNDATAHKAMLKVADERKRHPLREWLQSLKWDGKPRMETWLTHYLSVEDKELTRAKGVAWLTSAVARIMQPGCKADYVLILEGKEGIRKSTSLKILAGEEYFTDEISAIGTADAAMQIAGRWIIELAELVAMRRTDMPGINAFISRTTDIYRQPYGRVITEQPRQCVFAGTVNPPFNFPQDSDGKRRYWFVEVSSCDSDSLGRDRDQLWAEVVHHYNMRPIWYIDEDALNNEAKEEQDLRTVEEPWGPSIQEYVAGRDTVTIKDILQDVIKMPMDRWVSVRSYETRIGGFLVKNGWFKQRVLRKGQRITEYVRDRHRW